MSTQSTLLALARLGAAERIKQLEAEITELKTLVAMPVTTVVDGVRRTRKFSPAARKAASVRMKAYWDKRRKGAIKKART